MSTDKNVKKTIIHELDVDTLVEIAKSQGEVKLDDKLNDAAKFTFALGIKHGDEKISAQLVWHTYCQWKGYRNRKQPKPYFFRDFNKIFPSHRTKDGMVYFLNPKPFDTSKETWWLIRKELRHEKAKKNKKKQNKASSTEA